MQKRRLRMDFLARIFELVTNEADGYDPFLCSADDP